MPRRIAPLLLVLLALFVTGCDQATKQWAEEELAGAPPRSIVAGRVELDYHQNHGVAFNLERALPEAARPVLFAVGALAVSFLTFGWWRRRREISARTAGLALLVAGALGNLIDRFARGYVVDFVHVHGWPVFNVADVAIGVGAALLVLHGWRSRPPQPAAH
jgi:signal peptidase II